MCHRVIKLRMFGIGNLWLCGCVVPQMDGTQSVCGAHCWASKLRKEHLFHAKLVLPHYQSLRIWEPLKCIAIHPAHNHTHHQFKGRILNACIILKTTNKDFNILIPCLWTRSPWEDSTAAVPTLKQHYNHRDLLQQVSSCKRQKAAKEVSSTRVWFVFCYWLQKGDHIGQRHIEDGTLELKWLPMRRSL